MLKETDCPYCSLIVGVTNNVINDHGECFGSGKEDRSSISKKGNKSDEGKLRWDIMHWKTLEPVVRILTHGITKYGKDDNWRYVSNARNRYFAALMRHILTWWEGEENDPETGENHLAHAICNCLFLIGLDK